MSDVWNLMVSTLNLSAPLILAALGGLASERSGIINIALEGKMLTAACVIGLVAGHTGNAYLGLTAGLIAAVLVSLLHCVLTQAYRIDHIVSGMGINALAIGGTNFLDRKFANIASTAETPSVNLRIFQAVAILAPIIVALYLKKTRGGLRLLAVGNDPDKSRQMGINPIDVRYVALIFTGLFCGLGGAVLLANAGHFVDGMTSGKGFIALAALIIGAWRPLPALGACLVFGFFSALQLQLQGSKILGADLPSEFWQSLPYLATLIALAGFLGKGRAPAGLGKP